MSPKIIPFQKRKEPRKMFFLCIVIGIILALVAWHFLVENVENMDVRIPESKNINYGHNSPLGMTASQVAEEFEKSDNKAVLLYIYTTWCGTCHKQLPVINELAREFQNTELKVITLAIDRDLDPAKLQGYLQKFGDIYFEPRYLMFKDGFLDLLRKRKITYNGRVPFTVLIAHDGEIVTKFSGVKSKNYLKNKIIRELYL